MNSSVPRPVWAALVAALALTLLVTLAAAVWLGSRPAPAGELPPATLPADWTISPGASFNMSPGQMILRGTALAFAGGLKPGDDFAVQVRAAWVAGPDDSGYGLVVGYHGPGVYTAFLIAPDGYLAAGQMAGRPPTWQWRAAWQEWPHIRRGKTENVLLVECRAGRCGLRVNGEAALEVDGVPGGGQIGPAVWSPDGEAVSAVFREWRLR